MKTLWKVVIILIAAGLLLSLAAVFLGANRWIFWGKSGPSVAYEQRITELDLAQIKSIEISADFSDVEFIQSDKYGIDICYYDKDVTWSLDNGNLTINSKTRQGLHLFDINLSFENPQDYIRVYLPSGANLGDVSVEIADGNMKIGSFSADDVRLSNSFGKLDMYSIACNKLHLGLSDGNFTGKNLSVAGDIKYKNNFGSSTFEAISAKNLNIDCADGNITLNGCTVESIDIKNTFGQITASNLVTSKTNIDAANADISVSGDFSGQTIVNNEFGIIKVMTAKPELAYTYKASTVFGEVTVDNGPASNVVLGSGSGDWPENSLFITNSDGDIYILFEFTTDE